MNVKKIDFRNIPILLFFQISFVYQNHGWILDHIFEKKLTRIVIDLQLDSNIVPF